MLMCLLSQPCGKAARYALLLELLLEAVLEIELDAELSAVT